jgi:hypothetical protein
MEAFDKPSNMWSRSFIVETNFLYLLHELESQTSIKLAIGFGIFQILGPKMRLRSLTFATLVTFSGCVDPKEISRPVTDQNSSECQINWKTSDGPCQSKSNCVGLNASYPADIVASCSLETNDYAPLKNAAESSSLQSKTFYLEFQNSSGRSSDSELAVNKEQLEALKSALASSTPKHIIYFVHGFRNSANVRTGDPGRFAMMMAYLSAFIASRCDKNDDVRFGYKCDEPHEVIGVFIGWPAESIDEKTFAANLRSKFGKEKSAANYTEALAAMGFSALKKRSDQLGQSTLKLIMETTKLARNHAQEGSVKTLAIGHSLGGNILLSGLVNRERPGQFSILETALQDWSKNGKRDLTLPGADLFLLANPAAEANKWLSVQSAEWSYRIPGQTPLFKPSQLPRLVSFQSPCGLVPDPSTANVSNFFNEKKEETSCDSATWLYFELAQRSTNMLATLEEQHIAVGHYSKLRDFKFSSNDSVVSQFAGVSHTLTNNNLNVLSSDKKISTVAELLSDPTLGQCDILPSAWLKSVRDEAQNERPWDTQRQAVVRRKGAAVEAVQSAYGIWIDTNQNSADPIQPTSVEAALRSARDQLRTQAALTALPSNNKSDSSSRWRFVWQKLATDRNSPFWNMRMDSSIGTQHGGFYSRPLLCHFVQLWLDAPA